jgi:hypothetical protein
MKIPRNMTLAERQVAFAICCGMPVEVTAAALGLSPASIVNRRHALLSEYGFDALEFALNVNAAVRDAYRQGFLQ